MKRMTRPKEVCKPCMIKLLKKKMGSKEPKNKCHGSRKTFSEAMESFFFVFFFE